MINALIREGIKVVPIDFFPRLLQCVSFMLVEILDCCLNLGFVLCNYHKVFLQSSLAFLKAI